MKFEHIENVYPNDEFDRLGNKEDAKSPQERQKTLTEFIAAARAKVSELENEIVLMAEEDFINPGQRIEEKNLELKDAQAELGDLLKESNTLNASLDKESKPAKTKIDFEPFNN